ncbi:MAG: hypothetical protein FWE74_05545 [Oscillospiraceae bacterium]|nr:hypothetical protein [Oscillospiraceae bacterium]
MNMDIYDEYYELVTLLGKPALFSETRIDRTAVPKGAFVYDLRHGDDGKPTTIEPCVGANHAGTVIMTEPFDFGVGSDLYLNINNSLNFLGEDRTIGEFMEENTQTDNQSITMGGM